MAFIVLALLLLNNCLNALLGMENSQDLLLEIRPSFITAGHNVGFYKVDDTLNLTCLFKNKSTYDVNLNWLIPGKSPYNQNLNIHKPNPNLVVLVIENLQENNSGVYKCRAIHNGIPFFNLETSVKISVKNKKKKCTDMTFQCSPGVCILKRYTCDGYLDCPNGEDESPGHCGPGNPCEKKLMCPDNRCIPFTWCCESYKEPNCTTKIKHSCCTHVEKLTQDVENDLGHQFEQQRISDMGFLQTTVYTVIGCAMAFMFIVTVIVVAICRMHVRRTLQSRNSTPNRNFTLGRGRPLRGTRSNEFSVYDWDVYIGRACVNGADLMSINPLLVAYNTDDGIRIMGRPIDPPPYCEIVTSPPKEGPPPPYVSQENLGVVRGEKAETEVSERPDPMRRTFNSEIADVVGETLGSENRPNESDKKNGSCSRESSECQGVSSQSTTNGSKSAPDRDPSDSDVPLTLPVSAVANFPETQKLFSENSSDDSNGGIKRTFATNSSDGSLCGRRESVSSDFITR